ncbi:helix-turn-helix domain protein [Campylobacter iguaniorum]|uniref:helix-turn-helix domain-containing protein n=1 Tax=Campylobacter iguaniorum TaxID=1244531 RepID=UPI00073A37F0|nr:helix-turn-helix domain-containing protein [Campylobacter iguaniorum]ALV25056.1 helix-turn-helix domain protein [Campylobacter iguaniorum]
MSIKIMSEVWDMNFVKISHKNVLLALADCANDDGYCYPSISKIAQKANISIRSVYTALRELEECKYIAKNQRQRHDGSLTSNEYYITLKNTSEIISGGSEATSVGSEIISGGSEATSPLLNITTNEPSINHQVTKEKNKKENWALSKNQSTSKFDISKYPNLNHKAFTEWCEYKGKNYSDKGKTLSANTLSKFEPKIQQDMVNQSIQNNWAGLFEVKSYQKSSNQQALNECYKHSTDHSDWLDAKIEEASNYEE